MSSIAQSGIETFWKCAKCGVECSAVFSCCLCCGSMRCSPKNSPIATVVKREDPELEEGSLLRKSRIGQLLEEDLQFLSSMGENLTHSPMPFVNHPSTAKSFQQSTQELQSSPPLKSEVEPLPSPSPSRTLPPIHSVTIVKPEICVPEIVFDELWLRITAALECRDHLLSALRYANQRYAFERSAREEKQTLHNRIVEAAVSKSEVVTSLKEQLSQTKKELKLATAQANEKTEEAAALAEELSECKSKAALREVLWNSLSTRWEIEQKKLQAELSFAQSQLQELSQPPF